MKNQDQLLMQATVALTKVARAWKSACDKLSAEFGLSQATAWPAVTIGRLGGSVRPSAVAEALGLEPSSVVRVIDQLIVAGLVERHEDTSDRRAKILGLTEDGRERVEKIEKVLIPFRRELFQDVETADLEACLRVFAILNKSIRRYEESDSGNFK